MEQSANRAPAWQSFHVSRNTAVFLTVTYYGKKVLFFILDFKHFSGYN